MKKIIIIIFLCLTWAGMAKADAGDHLVEARVTKIINEKKSSDDKGRESVQQDLELLVIKGKERGKKIEYKGISDLQIASTNRYQVNDHVTVNVTKDADGKEVYYVMDYIRSGVLFWLTALFVVVSVIIGGWHGLKSLLALLVSGLLVMKVLVPATLAGWNPLLIGSIVSFLILLAVIYFTDGWNRFSHLAVLSIACSLVVTGLLSALFVSVSKLTGISEEAVFVGDAIGRSMDFSGLLLASILLGTLGVLDDVVIGQIETVKQIKRANSSLPGWKVFLMAMQVGRSHLGAIINTLFLAYAGASLPLLLLFGVHNPPFVNFSQVINNEEIATEIIRTLVGVIGLSLSMPISTWLAVFYVDNKHLDSMPNQHDHS